MFLLHWGILFTVSCFANLLGLNISSAFNSAVTIYILIPIFIDTTINTGSGVVVKFDKLNPVIGNTATVPSWRFDGKPLGVWSRHGYAIQRQWIRKTFYELDKSMAEADYRKIYFIPELESKLDFINLNHKSTDEVIRAKVMDALVLMEREVGKRTGARGQRAFSDAEKLTLKSFDSTTWRGHAQIFETLKRTYINRYNEADLQERGVDKCHDQDGIEKKRVWGFQIIIHERCYLWPR